MDPCVAKVSRADCLHWRCSNGAKRVRWVSLREHLVLQQRWSDDPDVPLRQLDADPLSRASRLPVLPVLRSTQSAIWEPVATCQKRRE